MHSIPTCRLEVYTSSFVSTVVKEWNALSTDVCESDSVRIFKEKKMHVSVQNENILTRYILTYYKTRPNFFNIWRYTFGYYSY